LARVVHATRAADPPSDILGTAGRCPLNRELAALTRMFWLAEIAGKVAPRAYIPMLRAANARKGFSAGLEHPISFTSSPSVFRHYVPARRIVGSTMAPSITMGVPSRKMLQ